MDASRTGHNYVVDVLGRTPQREIMVHAVNIIDVEKTSLGPPEDAGEVLNGVAFRGCVHDAEHLGEMILQELHDGRSEILFREILFISDARKIPYSKEQNLVLVLEGSKKSVLG